MNDNRLYIYNPFTSFTRVIVNIKPPCKYCKCAKKDPKILITCLIGRVAIKKHIYNGYFCKSLIKCAIRFFIYSIYNIYTPVYTQNSALKKLAL